MIDLLRTEWLKLRYARPFWVALGLYPAFLGGILTISLWGQGRVQKYAESAGQGERLAENLPFAFPTAWHSVTYVASWLHFIPAFLLILSVTNEFAFRTHRQILLDGWSRGRLLVSKLTLALAISLYCTAVTALAALVCGLTTSTMPTSQGASYLALFLLQSFVYQVFALLLAFVIRRGTLALATFLIYTFMLEAMVGFFINLKWSGVGNYLPLKVANSLLTIPYLKEGAPEIASSLLSGPALFGATTFYLAFFIGFMWLRFHREDL